MPGTNPRPKKPLRYDEETLQKALSEVEKGNKVSTVAKRYGVPRSTLRDKVHGIYSFIRFNIHFMLSIFNICISLFFNFTVRFISTAIFYIKI